MPTSRLKSLPIIALALLTTACGGGGLGDLGEILTGGSPSPGGQGQAGTLAAEIQEVRQQQQQIIVRTQDGQQGAILFDGNTQVVYQDQQYPVTALEQGDIVDMRVQEIQQGYYTDLIQVRTPVQERQGNAGTTATDVHQIEGTIGSIDLERWTFTLNMTQGGTVQVVLPSNSPASARDRLRQYRAGDYVQIVARAISQQQAELVQFGWPR